MMRQHRPGLALLLVLAAGVSHAQEFIASHPESLTVAYSQYLWPTVNGVATVYYVIDPKSDPNATPKIENAIKISNADFPGVLQWVPWNSSLGPSYVDINLSAGDFSGQCEVMAEGYQGVAHQPQAMSGSTDCTVGTLLHEMGHVIGLWHEMNRADRASYVTVSYADVIKGSWSNFLVAADDEQTLAAYDYASVMHYIPFAFSRNGGPVLESIPAGIPLAGYAGVPAQAGAGGTPAEPTFDYSAGDKETILRLYGAAPKAVTITSNPVGLSVIVDGVTVTTPVTYPLSQWPLYSTHTLSVAADVQSVTGAVLLSNNPTVSTTYTYTYGRWSDSASQSHSITVTPGNGSLPFPSTSPQVATYSANFIQLVPYTAAVYPVNTGSVAVAPQPLTYPGSTDVFFVARQKITLTATADTGWHFYEFNSSAPYFWLPGGLGANPKTVYVPDTGNPVAPVAEFSNTPVYKVDVTPETFSSNTRAIIDGTYWDTPKNFSSLYDSSWTPASTHSLSIESPRSPFDFNARTTWVSWSDHGGLTHDITSLPAAATNYIATVAYAYQPATNFGPLPPCGGTAAITTVSPTGDGFYPKGTALSFAASPSAGWTFAGWTYDLTGTTTPTNLTANDETLVYANFNTTNTPLTLTALAPASAVAGRTTGFTLTLTGTGFTPTSVVWVNGNYPPVTYVNATKLTVPVTPAEVTTLGAFQVYVENYPTGSSGCAVFGRRTFLVTGAGPPLPKPTFSPTAGTYTGAQSVMINDVVSGTTLYYTTDGSAPTTNSPLYSTAIAVNASETIKVLAIKPGYRAIGTAAAYIID